MSDLTLLHLPHWLILHLKIPSSLHPCLVMTKGEKISEEFESLSLSFSRVFGCFEHLVSDVHVFHSSLIFLNFLNLSDVLI